MRKTDIDWEVSVRDADGRVQTRIERALDRRQALEEFRDRVGWSATKLRQRLVRCEPAPYEVRP